MVVIVIVTVFCRALLFIPMFVFVSREGEEAEHGCEAYQQAEKLNKSYKTVFKKSSDSSLSLPAQNFKEYDVENRSCGESLEKKI
jgi:hypothetical protein